MMFLQPSPVSFITAANAVVAIKPIADNIEMFHKNIKAVYLSGNVCRPIVLQADRAAHSADGQDLCNGPVSAV